MFYVCYYVSVLLLALLVEKMKVIMRWMSDWMWGHSYILICFSEKNYTLWFLSDFYDSVFVSF